MLPRIEGFELLSPLGTGAMSTVYLAREAGTERLVALKVLHPHVAFSESAVARFLHEVRAYERLRHPNVIECVRGGRAGDLWYVALEHLEGGDLRSLLRTVGRLPPESAAFVLERVLEALSHAHQAGVVHRDVKPENVMIGADGTIKLADFGISKALDSTVLTEAGTLLGTPAYMAPEQLDSGEGAEAADLWSAGVLLYELVTGVNPFASESAATTASRLKQLTPAPLLYRAPEVPERLDDVLACLLVRDPEARARRAEDVLQLLRPIVAGGGGLASAEGFLRLVRDPAGVVRGNARACAAAHLKSARSLAADDESTLSVTYLEAALAAEIDPDGGEAEALAAEIAPRVGARRVRGPTARMVELEREAESSPTGLLVLVNLVRVARADGDLVGAARAYRWGRRRSPRDRFAAMQLATALGFDLAAHLEKTDAAKLRLRLQGGESPSSAARPAAGAFTLVLSPPVWIAALALAGVLVVDRFNSTSRPGGTRGRGADRGHGAALVSETADAGLLYLEKARAVEDTGDIERALALYDRFLREDLGDPRVPDVLFRAGRALEGLGRWGEARARYRELLAQAPDAEVAPRARRRLAALLDGAGETAEALSVLEPLLSSGEYEDRAAARLVRARLLENGGELAAAIAAYDSVLEDRPPPYLRARALLGRGRVLLLERDPEALRFIAEAEAAGGPGSLVASEAIEIRKRVAESAPPGPAAR